jgi:small multidrug resistance pump
MTPAWLHVCAAIVAEVTAALLLRRSDGFTRPLPAAGALVTFALAFWLISRALLVLPVSSVYPVWAGGGTAGAALLGIVLLGERAHRDKIAGIACVVAGVVLLNLPAAGGLAH